MSPITPSTPAYSPVLSSSLFDLFAESSQDLCFFVWDLQADYCHWSPTAVELFDFPDEYVSRPAARLKPRVHPADLPVCVAAWNAMLNGESSDVCGTELRIKDKNGEYLWVHGRGRLRRDKNGEPSLFAGFLRNLGAGTRCDATTGLLTAQELNTQLRDALGIPDVRGGLLLFGIDAFGSVNESYSYAFGNRVLRALAERLLALEMPGTLYRMEGDKFLYWQRNANASDLEAVFARFNITAGALPVGEETLPLHLTGSYVLYPSHGQSADILLARADAALKQAKQFHPGGIGPYTDAMYRAEEHDRTLRAALHRDVENRCANFSLVFQPQIYARRGGCAAAEALLRWYNPAFPDVTVQEIIPILEETGDILLVGQWVLRGALEQARIWQKLVPGFGVSVNLSGRQIAQTGFAESLCHLLDRYGLSGDTLCVELTHSCRTVNRQTTAQVLRVLHDHGITAALDDFGTGNAVLELLHDLPLQWVKLDRALVKNLTTDNVNQAMVTSLTDLAHRLKIHVCVKGIETEAQRQYATMAGADFLQGFLFSRPVTAQEFERQFLQK